MAQPSIPSSVPSSVSSGFPSDGARDPTRTQSRLYNAPFAPGGSAAVDAVLAGRLLSAALARGGDYADLFFEYRAAGGFVFDDGILKSVSRGVSMGLGVRVQKGDATGYAYVERLDWDAMKRAAETAAQIASGGGSKTPVLARAVELPRRYELGASHARRARHRQAPAPRARRRCGARVRPPRREGRGQLRRRDPRDPRS